MSSEAITQNDLREILSRTVGSIPSEYKKLLWTNPNPSTQFSAQTLSIDLTNFDAVEVTFKHYYSGDTPQATAIAEKNVNAICAIPTNSNRSLPRRNFKATNTGVTFGSGSGFDDTYTWYAQNDAWAIPQKIYGIKYERVAPPQLEVVPLQVATFQKNTSFVAGAGSLVFDTPLPEGAIIKSRCISRNPNAQWLYCGIHTVSATSTTVAYRNNFSSAFSGIMELSVFYEISN